MRAYSNEQGSILLEATIAMMLLTLAFIPLLGSLTAAAKVSFVSKEQMQVSFLLQKETELIKANYREDNFDTLLIDEQPTIFDNYSDTGFTLTRTVSEVDVTDFGGEPVLDSEFVKNVQIVITKGDKTYGRVSFLLYKLGL